MTSNPTSIGQSPHEVSFDEEIELHPPNESSVWDIPPKSIQSRIGRRQTERLKSYKNRFLHDLREAFDYSDIDNNGSLTFDAWCFSSIKNVIHEGHLSQTDYENYFKRIDVDCDGVITWSELVAYLMKDIQAIDFKSRDDAAQFIRKMSSAPHAKSQCHREMIQQIAICNRIGEYITVSSDSIRFWNPSDLSFNRSLLEPGLFARVLVFEAFFVMAVATTNRRLLFYDLENLTQLPVEMGASPSAKKIKLMTQTDAKDALRVINSPMMPLYNVPMTLTMADEILNDVKFQYFWIGDDQGVLEYYKLSAPMRRKGLDYKIERIARHTMHRGGITQISIITALDCYASSSMDHTVKFWTFNEATRKFHLIRNFIDQTSILGFVYTPRQKALTTCSVSRDAFVWTISPPQKMFKLGGHYNQLSHISDFITTTNEKYIVTMTIKKEFRLWDPMNYRMIREWTDPVMMRPENHYGAMIFDEKRHALITAASFPVKWAEDVSALNESLEPVTHSHTIVGCMYAKIFNEIVTVDSINSIKIWDLETGRNSSTHIEPWTVNSSDTCTVTLDISGRRLVTSSFKNKILIWNYNNGSVIQSVKLLPESPLITFLGFYEINSRVLLIRAGWDKTICAYSESEYGSFDLVRKYTGHTSDISAVSGYNQGIISGSVTGEIFEWSLDTTFPVASKSLYPSATVEVIQCFTNYMIVGDSNGMLHIFSIPKLILTDSLQAHGIIVRHSISSIAISTEKKIMFTADTLGYVKRWFFNETQNELNLIGSDIVRCHNDEITQIIFCSNDDFYATCSTDQCVRIWKTETNEYVGFFSDVSKWSLHDPTTWIGQSPFEKEDNHFTKKNDEKDPNEMRFVLPTSSVESVLSLPEEQMSIDSPDENDPNQSQQQLLKQQNQAKNDKKKTLDFDLVRKTLDEYTNSDREIKYRQTHVMELIKEKDTHKEPIRQPKLLHLSQRPVELLSTINNILNNDNPSRCSNTKPVLKIPMVPPRTPKSGTKKKSQSRMMYAPTLFD